MTAILDERVIHVHQLHMSIEKGLKLITTGIGISSHPNRNMVKLTEKGRKMGEKIFNRY